MNQIAAKFFIALPWTQRDAKSTLISYVAQTALFTLIFAACARLSFPLPFSPVPVSGLTLGMIVLGLFCRPAIALSSLLTYFSLGVAQLPIFALGLSVITMGPTVGYLFGAALGTLVISFGVSHIIKSHQKSIVFKYSLFAMTLIIAEVLVFAFGVGVLHFYYQVPNAYQIGVLPFVLGELLKISIGFSIFSKQV